MYSFIESDERVNLVLKFLDDAIAGLDSMESQVSSYKIHLNVSSLSLVPATTDQFRSPLGRHRRHILHSVAKSWFAGPNTESKGPSE